MKSWAKVESIVLLKPRGQSPEHVSISERVEERMLIKGGHSAQRVEMGWSIRKDR